ncbi:MAG: hypothetical protein HZB19_15680 [Chloroflexi bacterium]|nr:hypothetical protein [Chloroflexota bacterium]
MIYPTLRATVRKGKIQLLDEMQLPENALILVTVMDETVMQSLTLGERLAAGLQDILLDRIIEVNTSEEMASHLDEILGEA